MHDLILNFYQGTRVPFLRVIAHVEDDDDDDDDDYVFAQQSPPRHHRTPFRDSLGIENVFSHFTELFSDSESMNSDVSSSAGRSGRMTRENQEDHHYVSYRRRQEARRSRSPLSHRPHWSQEPPCVSSRPYPAPQSVPGGRPGESRAQRNRRLQSLISTAAQYLCRCNICVRDNVRGERLTPLRSSHRPCIASRLQTSHCCPVCRARRLSRRAM